MKHARRISGIWIQAVIPDVAHTSCLSHHFIAMRPCLTESGNQVQAHVLCKVPAEYMGLMSFSRPAHRWLQLLCEE